MAIGKASIQIFFFSNLKRIFEIIEFFPIIYTEVVPPEEMLKATQDLILYAVEQNHLDSNYTLYGHSQVRATTCPGPALFNTIKTWPHFGYINKK